MSKSTTKLKNRSKSKYRQFLDCLHADLVLAENRYKAADAYEDAHAAASEAGYCAGIRVAIDLFRRIVLEVSGNE